MTQRVIDTCVGSLRVRTEGETPGRPTAVLWHSLFVDERTWDRVVPDLSKDRRLVIITGPGHGASGDPAKRYTMQDCAEAALSVLDTSGVTDPVDWVGNAWGGHVGIVVAAGRPERIRTLVTAGTPVHAYDLSGRLTTQLLVGLYRVLGPIGPLTNAVVDSLLSDETRERDEAATDLVRDCFVKADRSGMANAVVSVSLRRKDLTPLLGSVLAPTLFLTGSAHSDWTPDQMQAAAALLPLGSSGVVDGAAYLVPLEAPTEFSSRVRSFWASHPTSLVPEVR